MRPILLLAPTLLLAGLALPAPSGADALTQDFSVVYQIDGATGEVSHSVVGTYGVSILCEETWTRDTVVSLPAVALQWYQTNSVDSPEPDRTIRYDASPARGELRVRDHVEGNLVREDLFTCPRPTLDATPALSPTLGMVRVEARVPETLPGCGAGAASGAAYLAPKDLRHRAAAFRLDASDRGVCLDLHYAGALVRPEDCPAAAGACVPFSGRIGARIEHEDPITGKKTLLAQEACSFLVVGGHCWGRVPPAAAAWSPCACEPRHSAQAYVAGDEDVERPAAVGTWASFARRAEPIPQ